MTTRAAGRYLRAKAAAAAGVLYVALGATGLTFVVPKMFSQAFGELLCAVGVGADSVERARALAREALEITPRELRSYPLAALAAALLAAPAFAAEDAPAAAEMPLAIVVCLVALGVNEPLGGHVARADSGLALDQEDLPVARAEEVYGG